MINYIKSQYSAWLSKKDTAYHVYEKETHLASIKYAEFREMFWSDYQLEPILSSEDHLSRLYSDEFWLSNEIAFKGDCSGLSYTFFIALHEDNEDVYPGWLDQRGQLVVLKDRPKTILLRGPYL